MRIDLAKSALENLYALINQDAKRPDLPDVTEVDVVLSAPLADEQERTNTVVTASATPDSLNYLGNFEFRYNRVPLNAIATAITFELSESDTLDLIKELAAQELGVLVDEVELSISELPDYSYGTVIPVSLRAIEGSFAYVGEREFNLIDRRKLDLEAVFTQEGLNGFYPVEYILDDSGAPLTDENSEVLLME